MAISPTTQFTNQASEIYTALSQAKASFDKIGPLEQIIHGRLNDSSINDLLTKIQCAYDQQSQENFQNDKSGAITILADCREILNYIDINIDAATQYSKIATKIENIYHRSRFPSIQKLLSFQDKITQQQSNKLLNPKNKEAFTVLSQTIHSITEKQTQQEENPYLNQPILSENQEIREITDEGYQVSLFRDQFKDIQEQSKKSPKEDFDIILDHYSAVKKYSISKPSFISEATGPEIVELLQVLEALIKTIIQTQKKQEDEQLQDQSVHNPTLEELRTLLEEVTSVNNSDSGIASFLIKINAAHQKLSIQDKTKLFDALNEVLLNNGVIKKSLGVGLRNQPFFGLPGSLQFKKEALEKILPAKTSVTLTTPTKESDRMENNFWEVQNMQPSFQTTISRFDQQAQRPSTNLSQGLYLPEGFDIKDLNLQDVDHSQYTPFSQTSPSRFDQQALRPSTNLPQGLYLPEDLNIQDLNLQDVDPSQHTPYTPFSQTSPSRFDQQAQRPSTNLPQGLYLPEGFNIQDLNLQDVDTSQYTPYTPSSLSSQQEIPLPSTVYSNNTPFINDLQTILFLLDPNASNSQLQDACQALVIMDSKGCKSVFKISDTEKRLIANRPFFHIYFIHKNESSNPNLSDINYGNKAFAGAFPATNEERQRAVKRTVIELALESLEDAINFDDHQTLGKLLEILESVKLDKKDRIEGQDNVAYNLFGTFYHLHVAARNKNLSLIDPHSSQFKGDFGRNAFYEKINGIDPTIKIAAIDQIRRLLKATWNI